MTRTLEFASHPGNLSLMRDFVRAFLTSIDCPESTSELMVLGIDEACTNIIRYAYCHEHSKPIMLTCEQNGAHVIFRLRDFGKQCDPAKLCPRPLDEVQPGGLGLHLMKRAFDHIDYVLQVEGTELVLTKHLLPQG